ncbi:fork head domain-containing protein [Paraphaeosphaeria sporulosa]
MVTSLQDIPAPTFKDQNVLKVEKLNEDIRQWKNHNHHLMNPMARDSFGYGFPMQYGSGTMAANNYDQTAFNSNNNLSYQYALPPSCPRSLMTSFPPPLYQMGPQQPYEDMDLSHSPNNNLMQLDTEYGDYPRPIPEDVTAYSTPYNSSRSSTPNEESPLLPHDDGVFDKDRPYAQLIFDALKQAPNHTMILRDIYDWFRKNTDKALDKDTKGWQNSIRHNLSMNGAFEKVDQPFEEAKKGFMWKLTQDALANGVKSTTRYRSKQPNKRGHRTSHYLQRQRAGAVGGRSAKKQLRHRARMHDAYRSDPYQTSSRSMPTPATFDSSFFSDISGFEMYPSSPSFYSPSGSEIDAMEYQPNAYGTASEQRMSQQIFHDLPSAPVSSSSLASYSDGYIKLPSDPAMPLFTRSPTDTPSPSASEPRTPDSQSPGWDDSIYGPMGGPGHAGFDLNGFGIGIAGTSSMPNDQFAHDSLVNGE